MSINTHHQFISKYPIQKTDESLILGTIHPHNIEKFQIPFFYGNKNSLWGILGEAKKLELNSLENIQQFLLMNKIAISDMILQCDREHSNVTADVDLYNLVLNNSLKEQILNSQIKVIYFTSAFNKNNAAQLFFDLFQLKEYIPSNWKDNYEIDIDFFGKKIKCVILLSPSGAANIGISKSLIYQNVKEKYSHYATPVKQFKIDFYDQKFILNE